MCIHLVTNRHILLDIILLQNCTIKTTGLTRNMGLETQPSEASWVTNKAQREPWPGAQRVAAPHRTPKRGGAIPSQGTRLDCGSGRVRRATNHCSPSVPFSLSL